MPRHTVPVSVWRYACCRSTTQLLRFLAKLQTMERWLFEKLRTTIRKGSHPHDPQIPYHTSI